MQGRVSAGCLLWLSYVGRIQWPPNVPEKRISVLSHLREQCLGTFTAAWVLWILHVEVQCRLPTVRWLTHGLDACVAIASTVPGFRGHPNGYVRYTYSFIVEPAPSMQLGPSLESERSHV